GAGDRRRPPAATGPMTAPAGRTADPPTDRPADGPVGSEASGLVEEGSAAGGALGLRYLGHASVLLDLPGLRILTDPFLRDRLGPLRRHGPLPEPGAIGPVGFVAISHAHPDHFDRDSLRALAGDPLVIVPRGMGGSVRRIGLRAQEIVVGETVSLAARWRITAVPARHWRWPGTPGAATVGYLIEGPGRAGIYFAGDTAPFRGMRAFAERVDIALLPVGSWGPHLSPGHLSPRSAAEVARELRARVAVPIHWGTLYPSRLERLLGDRLTEPANRFVEWAARLAPDLDVRALEPGQATTIEW
ncbi:MAG TPA: MBL fold metallo-hydrolase, partial [Candidatus Deferrimicrobium sp.]|nr:MBL fold metallo-hydrolase [Candidatus Deferrimicrobium sp.]